MSSGMPICINCVTGHQLPGEPKGSIEKIGPYSTYVAKSKEGTQSTKVIVSLTDVFGLGLKNSKIIADLLAEKTGYTVYVPDLFDGQPLGQDAMLLPDSAAEAQNQTWRTKLSTTLKMVTFAPWVYRNWPTKKYADIETFVSALKSTHGVEKIGAVGFCFGGKPAIDFNTKGLFDVTVANHPSFVNVKSFADLKGPIMINCSEHDDMFPPKSMEQVREMLSNSSKAPSHDFKVMVGTAHGFAARPDLSNDQVKKGFEEATNRTVEWFKSHL